MSSQNPNSCCKCTDPQYYVTLNTQGPQGRQGENGVDGFSPTINIVSNTPSQYVLSITDVNGTKQTPNLKGSLPQGGTTGMVLTRYGNEDGEYAWQTLPTATTLNYGITRVATIEDFFPTNTEEPYEYSEECALSPQSLVSLLGSIPTSMDGLFNGTGQICKTDRSNGFLHIPGLTLGNQIQSPSYFFIYSDGGSRQIITEGLNNTIKFGSQFYPTSIQGSTVTINGAEPITTNNIATTTTAGIVKPDGTTITVDEDGTLHGASTYNLPTASATVLGGVKIGSGVNVQPDGTISVTPYSLPTASTTVLGGIKVGTGLSITDDGVLSATGGGGTSLENVSTITDGISIGNQDAVTDGYKSKVEIIGSDKDNDFPIPTIQLIGDQYEDSLHISRQGVYLGIYQDNKLSIFSSDPNNIPTTSNFTLSSIDIGVDVTGTSSEFYINGTVTHYNNGWELSKRTTSLLPKTGSLKYWKGTAEQYTAIATKNVDTLYNVTDTQQVYLGTIPLTGGGGSVTPSMYAGIPAGGQNTGHVGTNTVTTYDPPTT